MLLCRSLPLPNTAMATRQQVLDYFDNVWTQTEVRAGALQPGAAVLGNHQRP
jgi:hypothetical protein